MVLEWQNSSFNPLCSKADDVGSVEALWRRDLIPSESSLTQVFAGDASWCPELAGLWPEISQCLGFLTAWGLGPSTGTSTQTPVLPPPQQAPGCAERHVDTEIGALFTGSWKASLPTSLVNLQYIKDFYRFREGQLYSLKPYFEKIKR